MNRLRAEFPFFVEKVTARPDADPENILEGLTELNLSELESRLRLQLPNSYKRFLRCTRGLRLFGGAVQFGAEHPFVHDFPPLNELTPQQRTVVRARGSEWPPPSQGMLCFAEYFLEADGDQVLFDTRGGLVEGEYPVVYYSHESRPPRVRRVAVSFEQWLTEHCVDDME